jgi:hypothetical protein
VDTLIAVFLTLAISYFIIQEIVRTVWPPLPRGSGAWAAIFLIAIVGFDWFDGRKAILGHPGGFLHEVLKLCLALALAIIIRSGVTSVLKAGQRNLLSALVPCVWCSLLLVLVLKLMGAW